MYPSVHMYSFGQLYEHSRANLQHFVRHSSETRSGRKQSGDAAVSASPCGQCDNGRRQPLHRRDLGVDRFDDLICGDPVHGAGFLQRLHL